jgi:hypothetical protein
MSANKLTTPKAMMKASPDFLSKLVSMRRNLAKRDDIARRN